LVNFSDEIAPCHGVRIAGARPAGQCRPRPRKRDIRVKLDKDRRLRTQCPACEWRNCKAPATHRAPKGAAARARILAVLPRSCPRVQLYVQFLRRHERRGHSPVSEGSRHRPCPTWKMGMNGGRPTSRSHSSRLHPEFGGADDPFGIFQELGGAAGARRASERRLSEFRRCAMPSARRSMRSASRRTPRHKR
jgi:hypothetical protein